MADVAVTNTFTNGAPSDATAVNTNFNDIVSWVNTNAIRKDGTIAFTAVPSGPASDPSSANQLSRKAYVDHFGVKRHRALGTNLTLTAAYQVPGSSTVTSDALTAASTYQVIAWMSFTTTGPNAPTGGAMKLQVSFDNGGSYADLSECGWSANFSGFGASVGGGGFTDCTSGTVAASANNFIKVRPSIYQSNTASFIQAQNIQVGMLILLPHIPL